LSVDVKAPLESKVKTFTRRMTFVAAFLVVVLTPSLSSSFSLSLSNAQKPSPRDDRDTLDPVANKKDLYPATADAKKEIAEALEFATKDKKPVLLIFGGNWCYDCHVLDRALHEGEAGRVMRQNFLLVHVDIGEGDKNLDLVKQYKTTLDKGVPIVVVLNRDGRLLYSSTEGEFEAARKMMKKDLVAFLIQWKEKGH
jgi:thiol:disulfide interchange protein